MNTNPLFDGGDTKPGADEGEQVRTPGLHATAK